MELQDLIPWGFVLVFVLFYIIASKQKRKCTCKDCGHVWSSDKYPGNALPTFCPRCGGPNINARD